MPAFEQIIRPFQSPITAAVPFANPGTTSVPPINVQIGLKSGPPKTYNFSINSTVTKYISNDNVESPPAEGW